MVFTEEQMAKLRENRNAIIAWIHANVIAPLQVDNVYGAVDVKIFYERYKVFRVHVSSKGNIEYADRYAPYNSLLDADNEWNMSDLYVLVSNWPEIKRKLLEEMQEREHRNDVINNFTV